MHYDSKKEKILKTFKDLMVVIGKHDDNHASGDSKEQPGSVTDASQTIHIQGS